jgi:hypothetical protein
MKNINDLPFCSCGCGERVTKPENKFINRHHMRINNPMKNPKVSEKVRLANIGRSKTEEEIEKIRKSCKGINKGKNNGMYGKKPHTYKKTLSAETKEKIKYINVRKISR